MSRRGYYLRLIAVSATLAGLAALAWWAKDRLVVSRPPTDDRILELNQAQEAVKHQPDDASCRLNLASAFRRLGRFEEAQAELLRAIQLGLPEAKAQREVVLLMAPRNWGPDMAGLFQKVVRENPDDPEVLLAVADSYAAKTNWLGAEPLYTRLIELTPDQTELYFKRGVARMRAAYFRTAVEDFRKVLAADPGRYDARLFLGHSLLGDARMTEAERELTACRQQRPEALEPLVGLAACAVERNDLATAETLLMQAADLSTDSPLVLQELAALYLRQQRTELAITTLQRLVQLVPDHRQGHLLLAQAFLAAGKSDESRKHERIYQQLDRKEEERLAGRRGMR